jgi:hypothetical protein
LKVPLFKIDTNENDHAKSSASDRKEFALTPPFENKLIEQRLSTLNNTNGISFNIGQTQINTIFKPYSRTEQPFSTVGYQPQKSDGSVYETHSYRLTPDGSNADRNSNEKIVSSQATPVVFTKNFLQKSPDELADELLNF